VNPPRRIDRVPSETLAECRARLRDGADALEVFAPFVCPCGVSSWQLDRHTANNGIRLQCAACKGLPFPTWFLPQGSKRRRETGAPTLTELTKTAGTFCHGCGTEQQVLLHFHTHLQVHHAKPYAEQGHAGPFLPLCGPCHEHVTAVQRFYRLLMMRGGAA